MLLAAACLAATVQTQAQWVSRTPFVLVLLISTLRLVHVAQFKRDEGSRTTTQWRDLMMRSSLAAGFSWAAVGPCTLPFVDLSFQTAMLLVALGVTAAGVATLAAVRAMYLGFMVPIIVSISACAGLFFHAAPLAMSLMSLLYGLVMYRTSSEQSEAVGRSLHLALENQALIARAEEARSKAEAASRAKSEFLARMSHEIRTPLNGVLGVHELVLGAELGSDERELIETAHHSGRALLAIINDLLDFSKIEAGKMTTERAIFELRPLVKGLDDLFGIAARRQGLVLVTHVDDDVPVAVWGDEKVLRQVLTNLMGNALKFTPRGEVSLHVRRTQGVHFEVRDTGVGIEAAHRERVFESFEQEDSSTSRRFGGTGLGLSISRELVGLMGGTLSLESESGCGSRFFFTLPLEAAEAATASPPSPSVRVWVGCRVLVVDDDPVNRTIAGAMLRKLGCEVALARSGNEALETLTRETFTLALMDCEMPERDGLSTTREWRAVERASSRARLPVVAFTAHATTAQRELCLAAEMDEMLTKPTTLADLDSCLERWATPERNVG
jgi:signal transduction histidine kinase/ActR/RegA family two-component response regulator